MSWSSLGQIRPEYENWTFWPEIDLNGDLFRLTHHYDLGGIPARLLVGSYYPAHQAYFDIQLVYPSPTVQLLIMPVPELLQAQGAVLRDMAAKITFGSNVHDLDNWRVDLDVWI